MILIPEIQTVVILVPRTGSGSLRHAIARRYPGSMMIYRHMEADGVPIGYDRWHRVGVVRHPVDRLWSLYKFMKTGGKPKEDAAYRESLMRSTDMPFDRWLTENDTVFTSPYDRAGMSRYWPLYTVRHPIPENRKSQWLYLRPDLGTTWFQYRDLSAMAACLDIEMGHENKTDADRPPTLSFEALSYMRRVFAWDYEAVDGIPMRVAA